MSPAYEEGSSDPSPPSLEELLKLYETIETSVTATSKSLQPLLERCADKSTNDLDFSSGLSLLLVRPHLLLSSIHQLTIMLAFRLMAMEDDDETIGTISPPSYFFSESQPRELVRPSQGNIATVSSIALAESTLSQDLSVIKETMEKVKGLEAKVAYQVQKLIALAAASEAKEAEKKKAAREGRHEDDNASDAGGDDLLSFKPNPRGLDAGPSKGKGAMDGEAGEEGERRSGRFSGKSRTNRNGPGSDDEDGDGSDTSANGVYRPPRVAAMPYRETKVGGNRKERKAPALLSEFATSLTSAPAVESTSGLAVRPVVAGQSSNSTSAMRLAELTRMREFEEENMTRLVMTKREAKRREEDEEALLMGFGVGGEQRSRSRRQGGFEAELEGVLGDKGYSKSMWDDVGKGLGKRDAALDRSRKRKSDSANAFGDSTKKKGKFEKAIRRRK